MHHVLPVRPRRKSKVERCRFSQRLTQMLYECNPKRPHESNNDTASFYNATRQTRSLTIMPPRPP